jgi:hypothetical protein
MDTTLDGDIAQSIAECLLKDEVIEWEGQPHHSLNLPWASKGQHYDTLSEGCNFPVVIFTIMLTLGYYFYVHENWVALIFNLITGHAIIFTPDVLQYLRMKNTRYAFSQKRVFFQLWRWGKKRIHTIDFNEIDKITYQEYQDKSGVIHFMPKTQFDFYTYDFGGGGKRFYPSFELVPEVTALQKRLETLRVQATR